MNKIYFNIRQAEESRIIVTRGDNLLNYEQETRGEEGRKGNIYLGVVTNLEPSLEAVFVDFGENRNGLLPVREIPDNAAGVSKGGVKVGDRLLVQIKKDNVGEKGAGLTGYISLAGNLLVLMPYREGKSGITANANAGNREEISETIRELPLPEGMSIIVRSLALDYSKEDIVWDLERYLLPLWDAIKSVAASFDKPTLIYRENDLTLRTMRNYFRADNGDVVICDDYEKYQELRQFVELLFPGSGEQVRYHEGVKNMVPPTIEQKIEQIYMREVSVASGIRVVFDSTEALVAIDVNSGRQRDGSDIEETALKTNLKAAEIICDQLRLRNLGGLVVIDFIDMRKRENREALEKRVSELMRKDRSRIRVSKISEFGLMQLSRQRTSRSLLHSQTKACPRCDGSGQVWREQTFALHMLRKISETAFQSNAQTIIAQIPREAGVFLLNEKRDDLQVLEKEADCNIVIMPDNNMSPPQYKIKPIKGGKPRALETAVNMVQQEEASEFAYKPRPPVVVNTPVLSNMLPQESVPSKKGGLFQKLFGAFFQPSSAGAEKKEGGKSGGKRAAGSRERGRKTARPPAAQKKQKGNGKKPSAARTAKAPDRGQGKKAANGKSAASRQQTVKSSPPARQTADAEQPAGQEKRQTAAIGQPQKRKDVPIAEKPPVTPAPKERSQAAMPAAVKAAEKPASPANDGQSKPAPRPVLTQPAVPEQAATKQQVNETVVLPPITRPPAEKSPVAEAPAANGSGTADWMVPAEEQARAHQQTGDKG